MNRFAVVLLVMLLASRVAGGAVALQVGLNFYALPIALVTTPIGLAIGLYEGYRLAGGLVILMAAMIGVIGVAMGSVVLTIRRERAAERDKQSQSPPTSETTPEI